MVALHCDDSLRQNENDEILDRLRRIVIYPAAVVAEIRSHEYEILRPLFPRSGAWCRRNDNEIVHSAH